MALLRLGLSVVLDFPANTVASRARMRTLFAAAGVSVAMGNAPAEVRAAADFVTATCEQGGLAQALERHILRPAGRPLTEVAR